MRALSPICAPICAPKNAKHGKYGKLGSLTVMTLSVVALAAMSSSATAKELPWSGHVRLLGGLKLIDDSSWGPLDEHQEVGIAFDAKQEGWPFHAAIDVLYSTDDSTSDFGTSEGETIELNVGFRRYIGHHSRMVQGYVGGGLALISSRIDWSVPQLGASSADGEGVGYWLDGGVFVRLAQKFDIGLSLRYSSADADLIGNTIESGGVHVLGFVGYFGKYLTLDD